MTNSGKELSGLKPTKLNRDDIEVSEVRTPYKDFFSLCEQDISVRRFDGSYSGKLTRAAFLSGNAVSVLPFDPVRDRVMLIEQFRFGPFVRGDASPWKLEAIAGRIDPGETPEQTAHREVAEESGLKLTDLISITGLYPAPGAVDEYMNHFIGIASLTGEVAGVSGLASENEDIKSHILSFDDAFALIQSGQADTGPLVISLLWLAVYRKTIGNGA